MLMHVFAFLITMVLTCVWIFVCMYFAFLCIFLCVYLCLWMGIYICVSMYVYFLYVYMHVNMCFIYVIMHALLNISLSHIKYIALRMNVIPRLNLSCWTKLQQRPPLILITFHKSLKKLCFNKYWKSKKQSSLLCHYCCCGFSFSSKSSSIIISWANIDGNVATEFETAMNSVKVINSY